MARRSDYHPCPDTTVPESVLSWRLVNGGVQVTTQNPDGSVCVAWTQIVRGASCRRVRA